MMTIWTAARVSSSRCRLRRTPTRRITRAAEISRESPPPRHVAPLEPRVFTRPPVAPRVVTPAGAPAPGRYGLRRMRAASSSTRVVALPTPAPRRSRPPRPRPRVSRRGASSSDPPIRADADASSNPYDVLGLDVTASTRAVRAAFRARAKDAHPDRGGSAEAFDALARAHELLVDDRRRAELDAELLDQPAGSFALEELRWTRSRPSSTPQTPDASRSTPASPPTPPSGATTCASSSR
jgi:hypothetical protein